MSQLVLQDKNGQVIRSFAWPTDSAEVIHRKDLRRLEVVSDTKDLKKDQIPFESLGQFSRAQIEKAPYEIPDFGRLRLVDEVEGTVTNVKTEQESSKLWWLVLTFLFVFQSGVMGYLLQKAEMTPEIEEELKQHVVKIVKPKKIKSATTAQVSMNSTNQQKPKPQAQKPKVNVKRMGALAALGSLKKSKQRAGVDLGAVNTSAGPGRGGKAGSGGVQTTLYGKGILSAPTGAGNNIQGAGGYGTKGKGGGKAGYGKLSLIGSAGTDPIPLGREAIIQGGLDKDLIASVIQKNIGQVRFCYEQGLQLDPKLAGRVAVDFTISGEGRVTIAGVNSTTLNSQSVENCILMRLKSWKFPLPQGGASVKVTYPFVLRRAGRG